MFAKKREPQVKSSLVGESMQGRKAWKRSSVNERRRPGKRGGQNPGLKYGHVWEPCLHNRSGGKTLVDFSGCEER